MSNDQIKNKNIDKGDHESIMDSENEQNGNLDDNDSKSTQNDINTKYNIQNQGPGSIIFQFEKDYDPPSELKFKKLKTPKFEVNQECKKYIALLLKNKFLILNCAHNGINKSIKQTIAQDTQFSSYLKYNGFYDGYENKGINYLINDYRKNILIKDNSKLLFFIDEKRNSETPLLNYLSEITINGKKNIINKLENDFYIVYITYHHNFENLSRSLFDLHQVDATGIYSRTYDFGETFIHRLEELRNDGIWSKDDKVFLEDLDKYIKESNFQKTILEKSKNLNDFQALLKDKQHPLARYVIFIATLFPKLSPDVFRKYVSSLISKKKKVIVGKKKISLTSIWKENADMILEECGLETYKIANQYCIDFASSGEAIDCNRILFKKHTNFIDEQARKLIDTQELFTPNASINLHFEIHPIIAKLTNSFRSYYAEELPKRWLALMENERGNVFQLWSTIEDLRRYRNHIKSLIHKLNTIQLKEDYLRQLKEIVPIKLKKEYNELLKEYQFSKFLFYKEEQLPDNVSVQNILDELQNLKNTLVSRSHIANDELNKTKYKLGKNVFLFIDLLSEIHEKDNSKKIVSDFFDISFQSLFNNYIILDILNEFHIKNKVDNFFEYYKQALNNKSEDINQIAISALTRFLINNPSKFHVSLLEIKNWFPEQSKPSKDLNQLEKLSLKVLYDSIIIQIKNDQEYLSNKDFTNSNTYCMLFENLNDFQCHFGFIITNVFKNADVLEESLNFEAYKPEITIKNIHIESAFLIESWHQLLKAIDLMNIEKHRVDIKIKVFTNTILEVLTKSQQKKLLSSFKERRLFYNQRLSDIDDIKEKQELKTKRTYLIELITLLKN